jgi:uncharacterized protein
LTVQEPESSRPLAAWTGIRRWLAISAGLLCLALGIIGLLLPVMPATPFLLLAGILFLRSSPRLHGWLRNSRFIGRPVRDWEERGGIRTSDRLSAIGLVVVCGSISLVLTRPPLIVASFAVVTMLLGLTVILALPSAKEKP